MPGPVDDAHVRDDVPALCAENERLRAALGHYADEGNWIEPDEYQGHRLYVGSGVDAGYDHARAALAHEEG